MSNKMQDSYALAEAFLSNTEKNNVIAAVFDFFRMDCLERCHTDPSRLDALIRKFTETGCCDAKLLAAVIDMIKTGRKNADKKENELVTDICSYILEHLTEEISIEAIAGALNISYYYMCHIFKNNCGVSVNTFRTQKRLEKAMRMLVEGDDKISNIALWSGFNNSSYFTESFTKLVGVSPSVFRTENHGRSFHDFYDFDDMLLAAELPHVSLAIENMTELAPAVEMIPVHKPDSGFGYLHEAAVIEYNGVLFASWYNCREQELQGYTPICGKRSYDGGKSWTAPEILCEDKSEKILYCPPVYGVCDGRLYMLVNQMVAPDHMHALDLYVLNNETDAFELLWSRPIPFKLNTNVVTLPNGKLMLPGRIAELDGFPNTPAVLISDSGKIDAEWRLVKIAENGDLPDGRQLVHPEISVMQVKDTLYMFCRNDQRRVPLVYLSQDCGETWSGACGHDLPYISSKIYAGDLSDGRNYLVANIDAPDRSKLAVYFSEKNDGKFSERVILFDKDTVEGERIAACHYPCACESNGKLYIIATLGYDWLKRGAVLFIVDLTKV